MNTFINLVKKSLVKERTRGGVGASKGVRASVRASSFLALNPRTELWLASSSCSPVRSAKGLTRGLRRAQNPGAIVIEI